MFLEMNSVSGSVTSCFAGGAMSGSHDYGKSLDERCAIGMDMISHDTLQLEVEQILLKQKDPIYIVRMGTFYNFY